MTLSIAILTTDTIHHCFFVKKLKEYYKTIKIFVDQKKISFPFSTDHLYEIKRDQFERETWFNGNENIRLDYFAECDYLDNINSIEAEKKLMQFNADIYIVFGTQKLSKNLCDLLAGRLINLHGGDPEKYRGLDSHLWALYHKDKSGLVTSLHEINAVLDDGNIINLLPLDFTKIAKLEHLRKENTEICLKLVLSFLEKYVVDKKIVSYKQKNIGRYYSSMPSVLKEMIYLNFNHGKYDALFK